MDFERILACFVAALAINEFLHIILEIWGARQKVSWLHARMEKRQHSDWPINIDTLGKTIGLHSALFVVITGFFFGVFLFFEMSIQTALLLSIVILVVTYSFTTIAMDGYHTQIGKILRKTIRLK